VKYRALAAAPVLLVALSLIVWGLSPAGMRSSVLVAAVETAKVLAFVGCVVGARAFEAGDYLRRAWLLLAACTLLLFARDAVALTNGAAAAQGALAIAGNGCSVAGTWMLARAWTVAGLDEADAPAGRTVVRAAAVALAILVMGGPLVGDLGAVVRGDLFAVVPLASDVADAIVLALLAPLLQTTLALQGGVLRWPWALLTGGNLLWLVFDAVYGFIGIWHLAPGDSRIATDALRVLATLFTFSAGVAQRWAVLPVLGREPAS
jgi:hypothetical protein